MSRDESGAGVEREPHLRSVEPGQASPDHLDSAIHRAVRRGLRAGRRASKPTQHGRTANRFIRSTDPTDRRGAMPMYYRAINDRNRRWRIRDYLAYMARDGTGKDGHAAPLFGRDSHMSSEQATDELEQHSSQRVWRGVYAPEDGHLIQDHEAHLRELISEVEHMLGLSPDSMVYVASWHFNTERPHAHFQLAGHTRDGREVRFDKSHFRVGLPALMREVLTRELGPRTEREIARQHEREVIATRFTRLDRELLRTARGEVLDLRDLGHSSARLAPYLPKRIKFLRAQELLSRPVGTSVDLNGLEERLRGLGRATQPDYMAEMNFDRPPPRRRARSWDRSR